MTATGAMPHLLNTRDLQAWSSLTGYAPEPFELNVFSQLEAAWWRIYQEPIVEKPKSIIKQMAALKEQDRNQLRTVNVSPPRKKP